MPQQRLDHQYAPLAREQQQVEEEERAVDMELERVRGEIAAAEAVLQPLVAPDGPKRQQPRSSHSTQQWQRRCASRTDVHPTSDDTKLDGLLLATYTMPAADNDKPPQPIRAACASESIVVLSGGTQLAALRRPDGAVLWQAELEELAFGHHRTMALQPTGGQVAICVFKLGTVSVRSAMTGDELYALTGFAQGDCVHVGRSGGLVLVKYSPDGSLLMVAADHNCTKAYDAATGKELHSFSAGGYSGSIDPSNTLLAMAGPSGASMVNLDSGHEVLALPHEGKVMHSCEFDDTGDRMVIVGHDCVSGGCQAASYQKEDGAWAVAAREVRCWDLSDKLCWHLQAEFSPGEGRYLLLVSYDNEDNTAGRRGRVAILDGETGEEPAWSRCLRSMMLPPGNLSSCYPVSGSPGCNPGDSVRWVRPTRTQDSGTGHQHDGQGQGAQTRQPPMLPQHDQLVLQAAIGGQVFLIDVLAFITVFEQSKDETQAQWLGRLCRVVPEDRVGDVLASSKASVQAIQEALHQLGVGSIAAASRAHPWLRALAPGLLGSETAPAINTATVGAHELKAVIEAGASISVIALLLEQCQCTDHPMVLDKHGREMPLSCWAVMHGDSDEVILAVLHKWPQAILHKGPVGTPLYWAAAQFPIGRNLGMQVVAPMLALATSFGQLIPDDLALLGSSGKLRTIAEMLEAPDGVLKMQAWLTDSPCFIMSCLSLAHAMRSQISFEPSRRTLYARTARRLMDLAAEFGLAVDSKLSRISDPGESHRVVAAVLQPQPKAVLQLAVRLHDIETLSVPWILGFAQTMDGSSMSFLRSTWEAGGGTEEDVLKPGGVPKELTEVVYMMGTARPFSLFTLCYYLVALVTNPLLGFRSPTLRYFCETLVYLGFVVTFTHSLTVGIDGPDPVMTVYAWLWAVATLLQEVRQLWRDPREYVDEIWNALELGAPLLVGGGMIHRDLIGDADMAQRLHSVSTVMLWLKLLQVCERIEGVGPLVGVLVRMLAELFKFGVLCLVVTLAWAAGLYVLLQSDGTPGGANSTVDTAPIVEGHSSFAQSFITLIKVYIGQFDLDNDQMLDSKHSTTAQMMLGVYCVLVMVLLLNLLIAVLSVEHSKVYEDIEKEFAFTRTRATLRQQLKVDTHTLPPPLNMLQLPFSLWSGLRGRGWVGGSVGQRPAWLCWVVLAMPVALVLAISVGYLTFVAIGLQADQLLFVKAKARIKLPLLNRLDPGGRYYKPCLGCMLIVLGPLILLLLVLPRLLLMHLRLLVKLLLGCQDLGCLTFSERVDTDSTVKRLEVRRKHWADDAWAQLIRDVMSQEFATAEVDGHTTNPLRLNSEDRMRWLCERTIQSAKMEAGLTDKVDTLDRDLKEKTDAIDIKLDIVTKALKENTNAINTKLDTLGQLLERGVTVS